MLGFLLDKFGKASAAEPYPACAGIPTVQSRMPLTLHPVVKEAYIFSLSGLYRAGISLSRGILFMVVLRFPQFSVNIQVQRELGYYDKI